MGDWYSITLLQVMECDIFGSSVNWGFENIRRQHCRFGHEHSYQVQLQWSLVMDLGHYSGHQAGEEEHDEDHTEVDYTWS